MTPIPASCMTRQLARRPNCRRPQATSGDITLPDAILGKCRAPIPVRDAVAGMAILETSFESGARG